MVTTCNTLLPSVLYRTVPCQWNYINEVQLWNIMMSIVSLWSLLTGVFPGNTAEDYEGVSLETQCPDVQVPGIVM